MNNSIPITVLIITSLFALSCSSSHKSKTLRDVDIINKNVKQKSVFIKPKSDEEIRSAYQDYLKYADNNNKSRLAAINRLADIEFDLSNKILEEKKFDDTNIDDLFDDKRYNAKLDKTINLLTTSLRDYPKEKNNDRILYQLAKAYEQKGDTDNSTRIIKKLIKKFPKSPYYIEAQFRLAESAFTSRDYITAEDSYTEVISSKKNELFYEKSTFKRGWARFKQSFFFESIDDFVNAIDFRDFENYNTLDKSQRTQYKEYYRSLGLAFAYAGGIDALQKYRKQNPFSNMNYRVYLAVSDIYLKQERFSDAVDLLHEFTKQKPNSKNMPYAYLKIINIWSTGGFTDRLNETIIQFYKQFNPDAKYWKNKKRDKKIQALVTTALKKHVLQLSSFYHTVYQEKKSIANFNTANTWYKNYLKHYNAYIRKDNIHFLYAELLAAANKNNIALKYYEFAAYDNELILNKNAAYSSIMLSNKLFKRSKKDIYLNKHIEYATRFSQLYPNDKRSPAIILHASELAFSNKRYNKAIKLTELQSSNNIKVTKKSNIILARSFFKLKKFSNAETIYFDLLQSNDNNKKLITEYQNNLAITIYKQAEQAQKKNNIPEAIKHYTRIAELVPNTNIAATGLYDAIALYMNNNVWDKAILAMTQFQETYPRHKFNKKISKKLSVAYLKSNQNLKAAKQFEKLSSIGSDNELKKTALWQAAELYEQKKDYKAAIRSYKKYAKTFQKPFTQNMESMQKLVDLNTLISKPRKIKYWRKQIIKKDKKAYKKHKTTRTRYIASTTLLSFAREKEQLYRKYRLIRPLKRNLLKKKKAMQQAVLLYGKASVFKISETSTEATYAIASIYNDFSKALLGSQTPKNLNKNEQEQYKILLEDQAFPFEEKAIEFYELNMAHVKDSNYNTWIQKSLINLKKLFPVRYNRESKIDEFINVLH